MYVARVQIINRFVNNLSKSLPQSLLLKLIQSPQPKQPTSTSRAIIIEDCQLYSLYNNIALSTEEI